MANLDSQLTVAERDMLERPVIIDVDRRNWSNQIQSAWVDVHDAANFDGDRRRFFSPVSVDGALLEHVTSTATTNGAISLRVTGHALVRIVHRCRKTNSIRVVDTNRDLPNIAMQDLLAIEILSVGNQTLVAAA